MFSHVPRVVVADLHDDGDGNSDDDGSSDDGDESEVDFDSCLVLCFCVFVSCTWQTYLFFLTSFLLL